jgi:hypothetical protein
MRPITVRRPGAAAAGFAAGLLLTALAGCGSSPGVPSPVPIPAPASSPAAGGAGGPAIRALGHGAYWDPGSDTVVVLVGRNVFQVVDDVPVNVGVYPSLGAARQQAATALAAKILSRMPPGA